MEKSLRKRRGLRPELEVDRVLVKFARWRRSRQITKTGGLLVNIPRPSILELRR